MKNKLWIILMLLVSISACKKEEVFVNELEEQEWIDDDNHSGADGENNLTRYQVNGKTLSKIKDYSVGAEMLPFQQDYAKHLAMWEFVTRLIPYEELGRVVEFEVFHGQGELLGYVMPVDESDLSRWRFALAIDIADQLEQINFKNIFTYTTIHEYGHVLTLNESQIDAGARGCDYFEIEEGCSRAQSYINALYQLGWSEIYRELGNNPDPIEVYEKYEDHFVSDYAASNPAEDIAEVFSFFITSEEAPKGSRIADQKIRLLYDFPELVELRKIIRQNESIRALKAGSWLNNPLRHQFKIRCQKLHVHQHTSQSN